MPNHPLQNANASWAAAIAGAVQKAQLQNATQAHEEIMRQQAQRAAEELGGLHGKRNKK